MGLTVITPPASEPITLAEAKAHCRIDSTDEDGLIAGYVLAAREFIENDTHLKLITQTLDLTIDDCWPRSFARGACRTRIEFPVKPIASVTSITYVGSDGATQTLAVDQYVLRKDVAAPFVEPVYGVTWPTVRDQTAAITVRFVAGWASSEVPQTLMQAMRLLIAHADRNREAVSAAGNFTTVPLALEALLSSWRWPRFA